MGEHGTYDLVVIGAGQGGIPLASDLAKAGMRVALVERKHVGGSCVNFGCSPTKAALASAKVAHDARRAHEFGIDIPQVSVDFQAVLERARRMAEQLRAHLQEKFSGADNPTLLRGHGRLLGKREDRFEIDVDGREICAARVVLDTGTRTLVPHVEGLDRVDPITQGDWLFRADVPKHLIILGGGYIGVEMAQLYRRLGCAVTLVEKAPQILPEEDEDVAEALRKCLELDDIDVALCSEALWVRPHASGLQLHCRVEGGESEFFGTHLLLAAGRRPNTDDLGLQTVGVEVDEGGFVVVGAGLQTSVNNIWACGDIRGGAMYTHTSWDDYRVLKSQIAGDGARTTRRNAPYAVLTDPQLGRVGMTEKEARRQGYDLTVNRFEMAHNGRAWEIGETSGFVKALVDRKTKRLLGAAVLSSQGAELAHILLGLMNSEAPVSALADAIFIHPTLAEAVQSAVTLPM